MPRWLKRKRAMPPFSAENPGVGAQFRVAFSDAERTWEEEVNAVASLATVLKARGIPFKREDEWLELENGLIVRPQFFQLQPRDDGSVQSSTTIEINHPTLCEEGVFEYQHSLGSSLEESMQKGFAGWADTDLPVFMDALNEEFEHCAAMVVEYPAEGSKPARKRQMVLGPPMHAAAHFEAFEEHIKGDSFYGIRLFASRDQDGRVEADCRVNGIDFPAGEAALLKYAETWPDRGFEMRKQFVAIRTLTSTDDK
jgi:hypothetical protein